MRIQDDPTERLAEYALHGLCLLTKGLLGLANGIIVIEGWLASWLDRDRAAAQEGRRSQ